jgi:hypothetical protein
MTGRDTPRGPDPDDWFADDRAPSRRSRSTAETVRTGAVEDDWMGDSPATRRADSLFASLPEGWVAIAGGALLVLVLLIGGLALAGVFSSSKAKPGVTTLPSLTTTAPPSTTTAPAAAAVPAPTTTLKPGDTGAEVKTLQHALVSLGYTVGTIDGDYGTATKTAVSQFQTASNLTADGVFGPATKTALTAALNAG